MPPSAGQPIEQAFELRRRAVDFFVEPLGVVLRGGELLAQSVVFRTQAITEVDELLDLRLQRIELGLHAAGICCKFQIASSSKDAFCMYFMTLRARHRLPWRRFSVLGNEV